MPIEDILKTKIGKHTIYSLGLGFTSLTILSVAFFLQAVFGYAGIESRGVVLPVYILMLFSGLGLVFAVAYNGFFGNISIPPIYPVGIWSKIAALVFKYKFYLAGLLLISIITFTILPKSSPVSALGLTVFSVIVFIFSLAFSIGFIQLLKNGYVLKRDLAEKINDLNLKTDDWSVPATIEEDPEFKALIKKSSKKRAKSYLNEILAKEIHDPEMSSPTITVLLLSKINPDADPPAEIEPAFRFWQKYCF